MLDQVDSLAEVPQVARVNNLCFGESECGFRLVGVSIRLQKKSDVIISKLPPEKRSCRVSMPSFDSIEMSNELCILTLLLQNSL